MEDRCNSSVTSDRSDPASVGDVSFAITSKDARSSIAGIRRHEGHENASAFVEFDFKSPYTRWWTFFTVYCLLLLCSRLVEKSEPAIARYSFIVLHAVFFVGIILLMLQSATRKTSHFRWYKAKDGVDYNRWGEFILDPDVSRYDYFELRRIDPTLPKSDPRGPNMFGDSRALRTMSPDMKWLHFSDELGSYEKRCKMYSGNGAHDRQKRDRLLRKLDPERLTEKEREILQGRRVKSSAHVLVVSTLLLVLLVALGLYILLSNTILATIDQWSQKTVTSYWATIGLEFVTCVYLQYKWRNPSKVRRSASIISSSMLLIVVLAAPTVYAVDIAVDHGWAILYVPLFLLLVFAILYFGGVMGRRK